MVNQWCRGHSRGNDYIWHDSSASVLACRMSCWLRKRLKIQPALQEVNAHAQRILRQKRADKLLDIEFCALIVLRKKIKYTEREKD